MEQLLLPTFNPIKNKEKKKEKTRKENPKYKRIYMKKA
jgi:hypothetical protein